MVVDIPSIHCQDNTMIVNTFSPFVKNIAKRTKPTGHDQSLIVSEDYQDISAYKISGHSSYLLSRKCLVIKRNLFHSIMLES